MNKLFYIILFFTISSHLQAHAFQEDPALAVQIDKILEAPEILSTIAPPKIIEGQMRDEILSKIEDRLNYARSLKAEFVQRGPQGHVEEGLLYLERPGKIRFQYNENNPILVVSNGDMLSFVDYEIKQVSRWPIDKTPLGILVDDNINLRDKDLEIPDIIRFAGLVKVSIIQPDQKDQGYITLTFEESTMELKAWEVIDVQGYTTRVAIINPEYNVAIDDEVFTFEDPRPNRNNRGPRR